MRLIEVTELVFQLERSALIIVSPNMCSMEVDDATFQFGMLESNREAPLGEMMGSPSKSRKEQTITDYTIVQRRLLQVHQYQ
jgi:hypothetical protein